MLRRLLAVLLVALVPVAGTLPVAADDAPTGYQRVVDLTFPVAGPVLYTDTYDADRGGGSRKHQATDIMADKLQRIHAAVGGEVCWITGVDSSMPSYGYMMTICGDDGLEYSYVHINNDTPGTDDGAGGVANAYAPGVRDGARVERGQWIAYVGDSGNAEGTGPHLHFSIYDPELVDPRLAVSPYAQGVINPFNSLESARARGDLPGASGTVTAPPGEVTPIDLRPESGTPSIPPAPPPGPEPEEPAEPAEPIGEDGYARLAGAGRVQTAVALSRETYASAETVVVVPAGSYTEALLAAPLAALVGAPVLLTGADGLHADVAAEVARLGAVNAYLIGGRDRLPAGIESDLVEAGVEDLGRLVAPDRYALSAMVAREMLTYPQVDDFDRVLLALGESSDPSRAWPDALSAGALAARLRIPVLLTRGTQLPPAVADVLADLAPGRVQVVGGRVAISDTAAQAAADAAGAARFERLAGANRYATSVAVAEAGVEAGLDARTLWVATGRNFPDALAAGPAAARAGSPLLLVDGTDADGGPESRAWLAAESGRLASAVVVGGGQAISDAAAEAVVEALAG